MSYSDPPTTAPCVLEPDAWPALGLIRRINKMRTLKAGSAKPDKPRRTDLEAELLDPRTPVSENERCYLIASYLLKRPGWTEGQTYLLCAAL
jgi:hypothetical protein